MSIWHFYVYTHTTMAKKTITIPEGPQRLMKAYLDCLECLKKNWGFITLRSFIAWAQEQWYTEEINGQLWLKKDVELVFKD